MKKYLVGGAVRDMLLKLPIKEKDWVVVGSSTEEMLKIGYEQVGKSFPVFLHPQNHEEYALARAERKSGQGHTGFACYTSPFITIEEDLSRRDLTINAIAYDTEHHNLIDPYHGQRDLQLRLLKHVSYAFIEDPLRVLRTARFAAKLAHMNFTIDPSTLKLMKKMAHELSSLSPERVWIETKKALITNHPQIYFQILRYCGALKILFPELYVLFTKPMVNQGQKNIVINTGYHTMITLSKIVKITNNLAVRFSILCNNIGKGANSPEKWLKNPNHRNFGIQLIHQLCNRLKISKKFRELAKTVSQNYESLHNPYTISLEKLMQLFQSFNCWRQPKNIEQIIFINKALISKNIDNKSCQEKFLRTAFAITQNIKTQNIIKDGFSGKNINQELYLRRLNALNLWNTTYLKQ